MIEHVFHRLLPYAMLVSLVFATAIHVLLISSINFSKPKADKSKKPLTVNFMPPREEKGEERDNPTSEINKPSKNTSNPNKPPAPQITPKQSTTHKPVITQENAVEKIKTERESKVIKPKLSMDVLLQQFTQLSEKIRYQKPNDPTFLHSGSAHKYPVTQYITDWLRKIIGMGNLNYPAIAKRPGFSSSLTMEVGIKLDGSIYAIHIKKSSGYPELDQAAKRIVRLSAPFPPLPKELRQEGDILVISRKWVFSDQSELSTR